jgi:hypothetical protein
MLVANHQASFLSVSGGSITFSDPHRGSMNLTFAGDGSTVRISGTWTCPGG